MRAPAALETGLAEKIAERAERCGGPGDAVTLAWVPYNHADRQGVQWQASVALLPRHTRGRYVSAWGTSPYGALTALDRVTADMAAARGQESQS